MFVDWLLSLMKYGFGVTRWYTVLPETEKTWRVVNRQTFNHVMFLRKQTEDVLFVCGYEVLREGVFVTQLSSDMGNVIDELCGLRQIAVSWAVCSYFSLSQSLSHTHTKYGGQKPIFYFFKKENIPLRNANSKELIEKYSGNRLSACFYQIGYSHRVFTAAAQKWQIANTTLYNYQPVRCSHLLMVTVTQALDSQDGNIEIVRGKFRFLHPPCRSAGLPTCRYNIWIG